MYIWYIRQLPYIGSISCHLLHNNLVQISHQPEPFDLEIQLFYIPYFFYLCVFPFLWILRAGNGYNLVRGDADAPCDYVIVLGAGINGETPSLTLQNRLERTIEYMEKYPLPWPPP